MLLIFAAMIFAVSTTSKVVLGVFTGLTLCVIVSGMAQKNNDFDGICARTLVFTMFTGVIPVLVDGFISSSNLSLLGGSYFFVVIGVLCLIFSEPDESNNILSKLRRVLGSTIFFIAALYCIWLYIINTVDIVYEWRLNLDNALVFLFLLSVLAYATVFTIERWRRCESKTARFFWQFLAVVSIWLCATACVASAGKLFNSPEGVDSVAVSMLGGGVISLGVFVLSGIFYGAWRLWKAFL